MKYSCCVLVTLFLCVVSLGWAQQYEGEACFMKDRTQGVCRSPANCPELREMIASGNPPKICSHANHEVTICCSRSDPTTTTTTTTTMTNTTTSIRSRRDGPTNTNMTTSTSMVDKSTIAGRKCMEYASYVYRKVSSQGLHDESYQNITDCVMASESLIVGGVEAGRKEFPHMAALGYGRIEDVQWLCGGSLISARFVVTAAHCMTTQEYGPVSFVRLGALNLYSSEDDVQTRTIAVVERIKHAGYKPPARYNDIALLKLESDVTFSAYIRPACLHTLPGNPQGKPNATASGWGRLEWNADTTSNTLMKVDLPFQNESLCNHTFRRFVRPRSTLKYGITPDSMICAGVPTGKKDTCRGDSGGPLQIRLTSPDPFCMYSIVGLVSFGATECGAPNSSAVYTRVSNYIPWIENHVWPQTE